MPLQVIKRRKTRTRLLTFGFGNHLTQPDRWKMLAKTNTPKIKTMYSRSTGKKASHLSVGAKCLVTTKIPMNLKAS